MNLFVHIGNGKTGSTSIQYTLEDAHEALRSQGVFYLGRMLEFGQSDVAKDWQTPAGADLLLHQTPDERVTQDVLEVLRAELAELKDQGIDTAVWSNEALFARNAGIIPALKALQADGVKVSILVYVRRHDRWARSAYAQWGIRHKSYQGPIKRFSEWIAERPAKFAPNLHAWNNAFGSALCVKNFDTVADVARDVLDHVGVSDLDTQRVYETPSPEELVVHAAYNDRSSGAVLPDEYHQFRKSVGQIRPSSKDAKRLQNLFPSQDELLQLMNDSAGDMRAVNAILREKGQPVLRSVADTKDMPEPDTWAFVVYLLQLNFTLQDRLTNLEGHVARMEH